MSFRLLVRRNDSYSLLVRGLATWRIAHMLVHEIGPFSMFVHIRRLAGIEPDAEGYPAVWRSTNVLSCVWCTSIWVSILFLFIPIRVAELLSLSAISCIVEEKYGKT